MKARPPWSVFRAALEEVGFRPSRRLGQNFLLDENMVKAIVRDAQVHAGDRVIEVGPGCGFLTLHLLHAGVELTAIEIDERLLEVARELLAGEGSVRFLLGDALAGKHHLSPELDAALPSGDWHLVSNLPYSISAPLLSILAAHERRPATMTVLLQREVAERIAAGPGSADWGPLSIRIQRAYAPKIVRRVAPGLFWPRPEVESAVVRLERLPGPREGPESEALDRLIAALFQRRRQSLGRVVSGLCGGREEGLSVLASAGLDPRARAEDLDLQSLRRLAGKLA